MKFELILSVSVGDDLVDTVSYVVPSEPLSRIFARIPDDTVDISLNIEGLKVVF